MIKACITCKHRNIGVCHNDKTVKTHNVWGNIPLTCTDAIEICHLNYWEPRPNDRWWRVAVNWLFKWV